MDRAEPVRPLAPAKARVSRSEHPPTPRQSLDEAAMLQKVIAGMEKKQRRAVPELLHLDRNLGYFDALHPVSFHSSRRSEALSRAIGDRSTEATGRRCISRSHSLDAAFCPILFTRWPPRAAAA